MFRRKLWAKRFYDPIITVEMNYVMNDMLLDSLVLEKRGHRS